MGPSSCSAQVAEKSRQLGRLLAEAGFTVLCGGGTGAMEAVARGASEAGGLTIGILRGHDASETPPNAHIQIALYSGISHARNLINVLSSEVVVAIAGGYGTLSEIALALTNAKPVVLLDSWRCEVPGGAPQARIHRAASPEEAVQVVKSLLAGELEA
jgi:uncharacterized protein (TIGR00725 family)